MIAVARLGLVGLTISALSMIGFVIVAETEESQWRYMFVVGYVVATFYLFIFTARRTSLRSTTMLACTIALASVVFEQIAGFYFWPGLVKDLSAFEQEHLRSLSIIICAALLWYLTVTAGANAAVKLLQTLR